VASEFIESIFAQMRFYADIGNIILVFCMLIVFMRSWNRTHKIPKSTYNPFRLIGAALCVNIIWFCSFIAVALFIPSNYLSEFLNELFLRWFYVMYPLIPFLILASSIIIIYATRNIRIHDDVEENKRANIGE
jgi:hypothetical protein